MKKKITRTPSAIAKNKQRRDENTTATFSLSKEIYEQAKDMARAEKRSFSNWILVLIDEEIARRKVAGKL